MPPYPSYPSSFWKKKKISPGNPLIQITSAQQPVNERSTLKKVPSKKEKKVFSNETLTSNLKMKVADPHTLSPTSSSHPPKDSRNTNPQIFVSTLWRKNKIFRGYLWKIWSFKTDLPTLTVSPWDSQFGVSTHSLTIWPPNLTVNQKILKLPYNSGSMKQYWNIPVEKWPNLSHLMFEGNLGTIPTSFPWNIGVLRSLGKLELWTVTLTGTLRWQRNRNWLFKKCGKRIQ